MINVTVGLDFVRGLLKLQYLHRDVKERVNAINFAREFESVYLIGLVKMGFLVFEILPMLIEYRILQMGNTVKMTGGDINRIT